MRDISHDSPESASQSPADATTKPSEPQAEARPPGHRPSAAAQVPATLVPETGWHFLHLFYRVDRCAAERAIRPHSESRASRS